MDSANISKNNSVSNSTIFQLAKENIFQLLGVLAVVFNLWLAYKLAPIATTVELNASRVAAIEKLNPITEREFSEITRRLDRIETKIDNSLSK